MSEGFRRRLTDFRVLVNAQITRLLRESTCEEGEPLQQRFQMFQQEGGVGPIRHQRRRSARRRMITFKVSLLRSSLVDRLTNARDATPSQRLVVALDLDSEQFFQTIRENIPDVPEDFELCKVNGQRWVTPLQVTCPRDIHTSHALGRSCLYVRPKPTQRSMQEDAEVEASSGAPQTLPTQRSMQEDAEEAASSEAPQTLEPLSVRNDSDMANEVPTASHYQPVSVREDIESDSSDVEELMLSSPTQNEPNDMATLEDILVSFREENIDSSTEIPVIARRSRVLQSACVALSKTYFSWAKVPRVEFVSEMAEDYGGPLREFFRLLMMDVQSKMGVLEGKPGNLLFAYNQQAFEQNRYYTAGKLTAWVIAHNGPGLRCLNSDLYELMCGQKPSLSDFAVDIFLDEEISKNLQMVSNCSTEADLHKLKEDLGDWICSCGVPTIFSATQDNLTDVHSQIVTHFLYHRVASMIHQFLAGMNSCGQLWTMVERNWKQFQHLFTATTTKLTREFMQGLFAVDWSPPGSNRREEEEATIFNWQWWLMEVQEGGTDFTFEEVLIFCTGADSIPPLGFPNPCSIGFFDQEPGVRRLPYSSTCSLTLFLPRGVEEEEEFSSLMYTALKGYLGFGKA